MYCHLFYGSQCIYYWCRSDLLKFGLVRLPQLRERGDINLPQIYAQNNSTIDCRFLPKSGVSVPYTSPKCYTLVEITYLEIQDGERSPNFRSLRCYNSVTDCLIFAEVWACESRHSQLKPANLQYVQFKFGTHIVLQMINTAARLVRAHLDFCTSWSKARWFFRCFKGVTYMSPLHCVINW